MAELRSKPSILQRLSKARRAVEIEPNSGASGVAASISLGERGLNVIVSPHGFEPGRELSPELAERGVETPPGWRLMVDVGTALGWSAPADVTPHEVVGHAVAPMEALNDPPTDGLWKASFRVGSHEPWLDRDPLVGG